MDNNTQAPELELVEFKLDKLFLKEVQGAAKLSEMQFEEFVVAALNVAVQVVQGELVIIDPQGECDSHDHGDGGCCGGSKHDDENGGGCGCGC